MRDEFLNWLTTAARELESLPPSRNEKIIWIPSADPQDQPTRMIWFASDRSSLK